MSKLPSIAVPVTRRSTKKGHPPPAIPAVAQAQRHAAAASTTVRQHRYGIGQQLTLAPSGTGRGASTCRVVALLPPERGIYSYRVRNEIENFERVVVKTDLAVPDLP